MNAPFLTLDAKGIISEAGNFTSKFIKTMETLSEIEEIDVGTAPKELVFREDKIKLYHYIPTAEIKCSVPVLITYALVNRYYMLDLQPDRSLIRNLQQLGLDLYIIDWDYPTKVDMYLSLDDYINGYLNDCVDFIRESTGHRKVNLMGICQGGTFSTVYSAIYPGKIKNLVTLVTPIDFAGNGGLLNLWARYFNADTLADTFKVIPGDFLNNGFLMMMPFTLNISKYKEMLEFTDSREKMMNFLRMEKWIFDSPGQTGECYRQFMKDFYQENKLIKGTLKIGDRKVDLKNITMPLLNVYAKADHLVPPNSTKPLNELVGSKDKELYEFNGGHIGVFVGSRSQKELAPAIAQWLIKRAHENATERAGGKTVEKKRAGRRKK
ncbi:MAG: class III poly(R)-hydroxyalkanoic acid synthase subunit PhaC [Nitrospirae bacterium]|nr:class III poly(R)-hydroxyalkanoic acid synthase subunit PhaC [Nitrospirota bacterium]